MVAAQMDILEALEIHQAHHHLKATMVELEALLPQLLAMAALALHRLFLELLKLTLVAAAVALI